MKATASGFWNGYSNTLMNYPLWPIAALVAVWVSINHSKFLLNTLNMNWICTHITHVVWMLCLSHPWCSVDDTVTCFRSPWGWQDHSWRHDEVPGRPASGTWESSSTHTGVEVQGCNTVWIHTGGICQWHGGVGVHLHSSGTGKVPLFKFCRNVTQFWQKPKWNPKKPNEIQQIRNETHLKHTSPAPVHVYLRHTAILLLHLGVQYNFTN